MASTSSKVLAASIQRQKKARATASKHDHHHHHHDHHGGYDDLEIDDDLPVSQNNKKQVQMSQDDEIQVLKVLNLQLIFYDNFVFNYIVVTCFFVLRHSLNNNVNSRNFYNNNCKCKLWQPNNSHSNFSYSSNKCKPKYLQTLSKVI